MVEYKVVGDNIIIIHENNNILTFISNDKKYIYISGVYTFIDYKNLDYEQKINIINEYISTFKYFKFDYIFCNILYEYQLNINYSINYHYFKHVLTEFFKHCCFKLHFIGNDIYYKKI
jgi:hypothetical protein